MAKRDGSLLLLPLIAALSGCGAGQETAAPAAIEPRPVDPAALDMPQEAPLPLDAEVALPAWQPPLDPVPKAAWSVTLSDAAVALADGRLLISDEGQGALERYLGILLAQADHAQALKGVEQTMGALFEQATQAADAGLLPEAEYLAQVIVSVRPEHVGVLDLQERIGQSKRAMQLVRQAQAHARAGKIGPSSGRNAVASYRAALALNPVFQPALDGLAGLEATQLGRALAAAQNGDFDEAQRWVEEARPIRPESHAAQDMDARIVELRQARADVLLAQGWAALEAMDLAVAARRLEEARRVSEQSSGLDALADRIELAKHYGHFRPRQLFRDALVDGGEGPELVVIPYGAFLMGSPESEPFHQDNESPQREVRFERGFAIMRTETTVAEFRRFVEATGYRSVASRRGRSTVYDEKGGAMVDHKGVDWQRDYAGAMAAPELPVVHVAFEDAQAYAAWMSAQTGQRYRLPSESEFEYALRAGTRTAHPWGNDAPDRVLGNLTGDGDRSRRGRRWSNAIENYADAHWGPAPVRSYVEEGFGSFDLIGNVSEWVQDCWHDSYRRAPRDSTAWVNEGCEERVIRGASWASSLDRARSAYRQAAPAAATHARLGFRLVREI